jgi:hypothetical protein
MAAAGSGRRPDRPKEKVEPGAGMSLWEVLADPRGIMRGGGRSGAHQVEEAPRAPAVSRGEDGVQGSPGQERRGPAEPARRQRRNVRAVHR